MSQNIVYFTSGMIPTSGEKTDIANLSAAAHPMSALTFSTNIQNGATVVSGATGYQPDAGFPPASGSVLVGAIPTLYSGSTIYTSQATAGAAIRAYAGGMVAGLTPAGAVVISGQIISTGVTGSGSSHITLAVSGGSITGAVIA